MPKFQQPKPSQRPAWLLNGQNLKMAQSAHAYVRGNTAKFYEWLENANEIEREAQSDKRTRRANELDA